MSIRDDIRNRVLAAMAIVLRRTFAEDLGDISRKSTPEWDSLKHIELMFALEDEFGTTFGEDQLATLDSLDKIVEALAERHAARP